MPERGQFIGGKVWNVWLQFSQKPTVYTSESFILEHIVYNPVPEVQIAQELNLGQNVQTTEYRL